MSSHKVAFLTAGGLAPCLSSAIGFLVEAYQEAAPDAELIAYRDGYKGLLLGDSFTFDEAMRKDVGLFQRRGGSPIGNSRVKLTNIDDCLKRGFIKDGETPLHVAAEQLKKDGVTILHTIGGDDTNTTAADLAKYLQDNDYALTVVGLPKTVDNDVFPIAQSLGALTAAEHGAHFFSNIVHESSANPRMLIVHEVMGRNCGWLTAATAQAYRSLWGADVFLESVTKSKQFDVHAVYLPEEAIDLDKEAKRLKAVMDELGNVNIFVSEGAGVDAIVKELEAAGESIPRDAFGHLKLDKVNVGQYFGKQFAERLGAEKVLVQKSGYFARSAPANAEDQALIKACASVAVSSALQGISGVAGHDEDQDGTLRAIEFPRIKGHKPFDTASNWYQELLKEIGQKA
ncbi:MAG: pyrophosphate--fructose-6-phosphate 1-phosphotransferase [Myxococcota bacterium]|nr:pyrophosphate--fructose-6-phosphate 1-phosphotransferase [Myxococcota bacterium]